MKGRDTETPSGRPRTVRPMMAYRACQPQIPGNKLQQKWDEAAYDLHREKVKSAKPTINTTPPKIYSHLIVKLKNIQLEEERAMKVRRENDMSAEKIAHITRTRGRVDNWNYYEKKSLGERRRQLELLRITKENERILFRLSQCGSHYNRSSCQEGWLKTLKVMDSIAHYPRDSTSPQKFQGQGNPVEKCGDRDEEQKVRAGATTRSPARHKAEGKATKSPRKEKRKEASKKVEEERSSRTTTPEPEKHTSRDAPDNPAS